MARALSEIEREIRELDADQKRDLLRTLIAELDAPADAEVAKAWLKESQRRYRELVEGNVKGVPGQLVFERLRARTGG
jgi:hypothetical protein